MVLFDALDAPPDALSRTKTTLELQNGSKIYSLPGANPDNIRGYSAPDLIIEDEAAFVSDRTFLASRPMLATSEHGRHILLTTPFGRRGHFYDLWSGDDPNWRRLGILSKDCPRIAGSFLDSERRTMSDRSYRQEYECEFLESATAVFPSDVIERLVDFDERHATEPNEAGRLILPAGDAGPWAAL